MVASPSKTYLGYTQPCRVTANRGDSYKSPLRSVPKQKRRRWVAAVASYRSWIDESVVRKMEPKRREG